MSLSSIRSLTISLPLSKKFLTPFPSSNLTFSLAPGWLFVETEDWRKDLVGAWSGVGADPGGHRSLPSLFPSVHSLSVNTDGLSIRADGWVYTNDSWLDPKPKPYLYQQSSDTKSKNRSVSVTRRRRWLRRIYYAGEER